MNDDNKIDADISALEKSVQSKTQKLNINDTNATKEVVSHSDIGWWSVDDAMTISASVLVFGFFIMLLATVLLYKGQKADDILKLFGTIIIVISAVFLVVAGYTDTQIAPVIGLLGTIAGYLLGRAENDIKKNKNNAGDPE